MPKKAIAIIGLLLAACGGQKMLYEFDFATDPVAAGWTFEPGAKDDSQPVYIPSEGYYSDKGAKWKSPKIAAVENEWQFYCLEFASKADELGYYAVFFYDQDGNEIVDDNYASYYKSDDFVANRVVFRGREHAKTFTVNFIGKGKFFVRDVKVYPVSDEFAAQWADDLYAKLPRLDYTPDPGRWKLIPKTIERLNTGGPIRIVMLGDSIINDTNNSNFDALLKRLYPRTDIRMICSVRGSTGCWHYRIDEHFQSYVADRRPDFLIIGGISQRDDIDAIRDVIEKTRAQIGCEILLMSGPVGADWRKHDEANPDRPLSKIAYPGQYESEKKLAALAAELGVEYLDMKKPWNDYLGNSEKPYMYFHRDRVHAEDRGKQVLARILERYFEPKK